MRRYPSSFAAKELVLPSVKMTARAPRRPRDMSFNHTQKHVTRPIRSEEKSYECQKRRLLLVKFPHHTGDIHRDLLRQLQKAAGPVQYKVLQ